MTREDNAPDQAHQPEPDTAPDAENGRDRFSSDPTPPTVPIGDSTLPLDLPGLARLLNDIDQFGTIGSILPESASTSSKDSTALLRELKECLSLAMGSWPRPGDPVEGAPRRIGRFELLEVRGRGGFGIVYRAFDPLLRRMVALKVPRVEGLALPDLRRRFLREARAAGILEHPNIVPVYEAGEDGPLCFLAAAFVDGPTLSTWLRQKLDPIPPGDAATLVADMADAVQHAHDRGVLHRDLKPGNVLLQGIDTRGLGPRLPIPRLTDFGLAKLIREAGEETRSGVPMGSPSYMSPEQASGKNREVGPAADVYGLGAILYEILTGQPPFRGESAMETMALVLAEEPVPPRMLRPGLPRDLETICLTCLRKEPARRYDSASALAADLRRWLAGEPIAARPASAWEHLRHWARRQPLRAASLVMMAILAGLALGGLVVRNAMLSEHRRQLERINEDERAARELAERRINATRLKQANDALDLDQIERAQDILHDLVDRLDGSSTSRFVRDYLRHKAGREVDALRGHNRRVVQLAVAPGTGAVASVDQDETLLLHLPGLPTEPIVLNSGDGVRGATYPEFSPDGLLVAANETDGSGEDRRLRLALWDASSGGLLARLEPDETEASPSWFAFPAADLLVASYHSGDGSATLRSWSVAKPDSPALLSTIPVPPGTHVAAGGGTLAIASPGRLALLDPRSGTPIQELPDPPRHPVTLALSLDGRSLCLCDSGTDFSLRDATTGAILNRAEVAVPMSPPNISPGGDAATMVDREGTVTVLTRDNGPARPLRFRPDAPSVKNPTARLDLSPDGRRLALSFWNNIGYSEATTVRSLDDRSVLATYPGRDRPVSELRFAPDGQSVIIAAGQTIRRWSLDPPPDSPQPAGHLDEAWSVAFSPDGRILATGADTPDEPLTLKLWDVDTGHLIRGWDAHPPATVSALAFSPDGSLLASAGLESSMNLRLWNPKTGKLVAELIGHTDKVRTLRFSPDGSLLASAGSDRTIRIWDVATRRCLAVLSGSGEIIRQVAFAPDGQSLASCDNSGEVRLWDLRTRIGRIVLNRSDSYTSLAFSPDGSLLAVGDEEGSVTLLDPETWSIADVLRGDEGKILALAFSPDSRALAAAGLSGTIRVWDPVAGQEVLTLDGHRAQVNDLAFSPDGQTLASACHDGGVLLWRSCPSPSPAN